MSGDIDPKNPMAAIQTRAEARKPLSRGAKVAIGAVVIGALAAIVVVGQFQKANRDEHRASLDRDLSASARAAVQDSEDIDDHRAAFEAAAAELVTRDRECTPSDFREAGGWMHISKTSPVTSDELDGNAGYFIHCTSHVSHRWYVAVHAEDDGWYRLFQAQR